MRKSCLGWVGCFHFKKSTVYPQLTCRVFTVRSASDGLHAPDPRRHRLRPLLAPRAGGRTTLASTRGLPGDASGAWHYAAPSAIGGGQEGRVSVAGPTPHDEPASIRDRLGFGGLPGCFLLGLMGLLPLALD